jgi:hypothetical protein
MLQNGVDSALSESNVLRLSESADRGPEHHTAVNHWYSTAPNIKG